MNKDASRKAAGLNRDMQREFAQKGIRWKVEDAKAAGIHPLYALGASTSQFAPSFVGDTSMGSAMADIGQDISRSIQATRTAPERAQANAVAAQMSQLALERATLENELLKSRIARESQGQIGPPMAQATPVSGGFQIVPQEITSNAGPGMEHQTAGPPQPGLTRYDMGPMMGHWNLMSEKATEAAEDMDMLKYAVLAANNAPWRIKLSESDIQKPGWVKQLEYDKGRRMRPFMEKGVVYWEFSPQSHGGRVGTVPR